MFFFFDVEQLMPEFPLTWLIFQSAVGIFKSINQVDRMVEAACIQIVPSESQVKIELRCKFNVTKSYVIPFLEADTVKVIVKPNIFIAFSFGGRFISWRRRPCSLPLSAFLRREMQGCTNFTRSLL